VNEQEFNGQRYEPPRPAREGKALTPAGERAAPDYPGTLHTGSISGIGTVASLQRLAGNKAVASYIGRLGRGSHASLISRPTVQREVNKKGTFVGWGGTNDGNVMVNANASVDVSDGAKTSSYPAWFINAPTETIEVDPGASGTVMMRLPWYWHHHGIVQEPGRIYGTNEKHIRVGGGPIDYWVSAPFAVTPDGKVAFTNAAPGGTIGALGYLEGVPTISPKDGEGSGSLTVSLTFKALQSTTTTDTGTRTTTSTLSGSGTGTAAPGGVGGSATGGASYAVSEANSHAIGMTLSGTTSVTCSFGINLRVKVPPKITKTKTILYNAEGKFISGNDGILGVNEWWGTIPPAVKELIIAGKKPVRITGRASQTGSPKRNEIVIANRIADVKTRLGNVAGRMDILPDSEFTAPNERSVVIRVEYTTAEEKAGGGAPAKP